MAATVGRLRSALVPGAAVALAVAALTAARPRALEDLELALLDARAAAVAARSPASDEVALVLVDEPTVRLAGGVHPLPRGALAAVVDEARRAGARVVALDYLLQDPLEGVLASENADLERAIAGGGVVLAAALPRAGAPAPPPAEAGAVAVADDPRRGEVLRRHAADLGGAARPERFALATPLPRFALAAAALGGVSQEQAGNGRIYALRHVYPAAEGDYMSLPLAAAWLARGRPPTRLERDRLVLGPVSAPLAPDGRVYLRWKGARDGRRGGPPAYPAVSAAALLRARLAREGAGEPPAAAELAPLAGRVAVVCAAVAGAKDKHPTPLNPAALGGELVATAIDNLLSGEFTRRLPPWGEAAAALALALACALLAAQLASRTARPWAAAGLSAAGAGLLLAAWWRLSTAALGLGLWLPAVGPLAGGLLTAFSAELGLYALERRDRRFIHEALGRYTSPALVQRLLENREQLERFGGARQDLTVYFSDIRGFTSISEGMDPERLVLLLNEYLSAVTEVIEQHGGYVDKYIGDAVMAVWGAPLATPDHARRACAAALGIRDRLMALRPGWRERFGVELHTRAGINTGPMVAGNIGSRRKANYTVLGDSVNLASRLEGANKTYGTEILLGVGTVTAARGGIVARFVDALRVKGKNRSVWVYELLGLGPPAGAEAERLARWEAAVASYRAGRFADALAAFEEERRRAPRDGVAAVYVARCRELALAPPPVGWDGVHVMHEK